jgi:hypothetical protein
MLFNHILNFLREACNQGMVSFLVIFILLLYPTYKLEKLAAKKIKNTALVAGFLLFSISLLTRLFLFSKIPTTSISAEYSDALSNHFWEYFWNDSYKPPLNTLIFATLNIFTSKNLIIFTLIFDSIAIQLLYSACIRFTKKPLFSFAILSLYSVTIFPFEFWREGTYWDHYSTILIANLIYWLSKIRKDHSTKTLLLTSLSGGLLISQSTVNVAIIPIYFLILVIILFLPKKDIKTLISSYAKLLLFPILVTLFCLTKNYMSYGIFATSILGGEGLILTTTRMFDQKVHPDIDMYKKEILKTRPPDWWMWCWEWGTKNYADSNASTYYGNTGYCYRFIERPSHCTPSTSKTIDFSPILNYLKKNGPQEVLKAVEKSQYETCYKPWLNMPSNLEFRHKFRGPHSEATVKVAKGIIQNNLSTYLKSTLRLHTVHGVLGPRLQMIWVNSPKIGPWELIHKLGRYLQSKTYKRLLKAHEYIMSFSYITAWLIFVVFSFNALYLFLKRTGFYESLNYLKVRFGKLLFFMPPVFGNAFLFTMAVGGENHRYFFQSTPYLIVFFIILISQLQNYFISKGTK